MTKLILLGAGGHCESVIDVIESLSDYKIHGILDPLYENDKNYHVLGYHVMGNDDKIGEFVNSGFEFVITVGQIKSANIREKLFERVKAMKGRLPVIIAKNAYVSRHSFVGEGTVIMNSCMINSNSCIGKANIINTSANIEHGCVIGDFNHISTRVTINGGVTIGNRVFIGSGSIVNEQIVIENDIVIGSGSVIRKNIPLNTIAYGNPLKIVDKFKDMNKNKVIIIAEAGVNHNGDINIAKKLIEAAAEAGADYVKFQTFNSKKIVSKNALKANYQIENTNNGEESQLEMLQKLELTPQMHFELIDHCKKSDIKFLSTGFDLESLDFLNQIGIDLFKVPSGEITNLPYLRRLGSMGKPVIISTGMATMEEIQDTLNVIIKAGTKKSDVTILHCNTEYPTPMEDVNLKAMLSIKEKFQTQVGYSDHTLGIEVPIAAVAMGATVIEKHFTLDKNMEGPDHKASLNPFELKEMIKAIRNIEVAVGDGLKIPSKSELKNKSIARKSIVASVNIAKGTIFTENNLTVKRPGNGISPKIGRAHV